MRRALAVAVTAALLAGAPAAAAARPAAVMRAVHLNQVQVVATHNSYKREISPAEQATFEAAIRSPGTYARFLAYSHAPLRQQLEGQRVRGLELDLFSDPQGGLYVNPLVRTATGLGPVPDPAWQRPGIKVFHVADLDYRSTCVLLTACLRLVHAWSVAHPRHLPVFVLLELKQSDPLGIAAGGVVAPPWDTTNLDELDREIRSVFSGRELVTPDDVRRRGSTLERSVRRFGWPTLRSVRGKVLFLMDNGPGPVRDAYRSGGRDNLEGRVLFTNSVPGQPDAAFMERDDPTAELPAIRELVRQGYLVRTRADDPLTTVLEGDTRRRTAAFASGAQIVSTDFPVPGMAARYDSDYVAHLPGGAAGRCDPVDAPPRCRDAALERRP